MTVSLNHHQTHFCQNATWSNTLLLLAGCLKFNFLICFEVAASYLMIELSVSFIQFDVIFNFVFSFVPSYYALPLVYTADHIVSVESGYLMCVSLVV